MAGCQRPDGGFAGRQGGSDPYYTDFALRTLAWLAPGHAAFDRAADYLAAWTCPPRDVVECFNAAQRRAASGSGMRSTLAGARRGAATRCHGPSGSYAHVFFRAAVLPDGPTRRA